MSINPKAAGLAAGTVAAVAVFITIGCYPVLGRCEAAIDVINSAFLGVITKDVLGAFVGLVIGFFDFFIVGFSIAWLLNYFDKKLKKFKF
jgi:hypothetical protein